MTKMMMAAAAFALVAGNAEAKTSKAPTRKAPVYVSYDLRTGEKVKLSESQYAIVNGKWAPLSPQQIAALAAKITVAIYVQLQDGTYASGTGFFWNEQIVITNYHMTRNVKAMIVVDAAGNKFPCSLYKGNPQLDLALIQVEGAHHKDCAYPVTDSDWEQIGEKVYVYGSPSGVEGTFSAGMIAACRASQAIFQISAPLDHGSSGSPVFNEYGLVIGIIQGGVDDTKAQIAYAISSNAIFEALGLKNEDHPKGFSLGLTKDLDLRSKDQIAADNAAATPQAPLAETPVPAGPGQS